MRSYIETIACFMILAAFIQMVAPEKFRRDIAFLLGIVMLLVICRPLSGLVADPAPQKAVQTYAEQGDYEALKKRMLSDGMKKELERVIAEQTGAERAEADIGEENEIRGVVLYGEVDEDARKTAARLCGIDKKYVRIKEK